jgi:anti-sigma regulatory factor (Ser/Thr protein kinase)
MIAKRGRKSLKMYLCLTRVIAVDIKHRFQKRELITLSTENFNFKNYADQCSKIIQELTLNVENFWIQKEIKHSKDDILAVSLILEELITNAVTSSLARLEKLRAKQPENEHKNPSVKILLQIFDSAVEINVEDCGPGLPRNLTEVPRERFKVVCNYVSGALGLDLIKKLAQIVLISYRHKSLGFTTSELDPEKINGSIIKVWRFAIGRLN